MGFRNKIVVLIQILTIICLASFTGAMIMLYTAILAFWKQSTSEEFLNWYVNYSSGITDSTGPFLMSSIIMPLICIFLIWKHPQSRKYWVISASLSGMIMIITLSYFVNVNTSFGNKSIAVNQIKETLIVWGNLHLLRISIALVSALSASIGLIKYLSKIK